MLLPALTGWAHPEHSLLSSLLFQVSVLTYPDNFERPAEQHVLGGHQGAHRVVMGLNHLDVLVVIHVPHLMAAQAMFSLKLHSVTKALVNRMCCARNKSGNALFLLKIQE